MFKTKRNKKEKGQGLVEYALILVLVAIVVIAVLMLLGPIIGNVFSSINSSLSGATSGGGAPAAPAGPVGSDHPSYTKFAGNYGNTADAMSTFCDHLGAPSGATVKVYSHLWYYYGGGGGTTEAMANAYQNTSTYVTSGTCP